jgi:hypothetical protein
MAAVLSSNPNAAVLEAIRDNPRALDSDRIRATSELQKIASMEKMTQGGTSDLVALRQLIEVLPAGERVAWLRDEKNATKAEREGGAT